VSRPAASGPSLRLRLIGLLQAPLVRVLGILRRMDGCVFCRVAEGKAPAQVLFADDEVVAFHDLHPQAPVHVLVIPRRHVASLAAAEPADAELLGRLQLACAEAARRTGIDGSGYRVVANSGAGAGQSVFHLHYHVLGRRHFSWPPG